MAQREVPCRRLLFRARTDRWERRRSRFQASKKPISTSPGITSCCSREKGNLSAETCRRETLIARGLTPVAQTGFFSSDPSKGAGGLPNVPVIFLRLGDVRVWAQIDTGYEDFVYSHSIDINQALFDRLVGSGVKLDRINDIDIWTCDGREHRPVYRIKDRPMTIENESGKAILKTEDFHLVVKSANSCGGIADMKEPAAQLGASFLDLFGEVIFDPKNATVWLGSGGH
jgi:hypothetical protein